MEGIKYYRYNGENKIVSIETTNLKQSLEYKRLTLNRFEFLDRKIDLVDKASKINDLDFNSSETNNCSFIKAIVQYSMLYNKFINKNLSKQELDEGMQNINGLLEETVNEIEKADAIKRADSNFCRFGINYGRDHIEKGLEFIFGRTTFF
jgi:NADH dehydrogenase/NADH:ubiquinone oxidoreductase subunit G